jgi:hypothetical protein
MEIALLVELERDRDARPGIGRRDQGEPQEEQHRRVAEVLREPPADLDVRRLDHVRWVDPALQPPVEPELKHPAQPGPIPLKQALASRRYLRRRHAE